MVSMGSILGGAFGLVARRPAAVAVWTLLYLFGSAAIGLVQVAMVTRGPAAPVPLIGAQTVGQLLSLALTAVVMGAVFRAVLQPEARSLASIRIGMDEARLFLLLLIVMLVFFVGGFVMSLLNIFLISGLAALSRGDPFVIAIAQSLTALLFLCGLVYVMVRLSLAWPMTFYRHRLTVDAAWELARGRFWLLFLSYLIVSLVLFAGWFALVGALFGDLIVATYQAAPTSPQAAQILTAQLGARAMAMSPMVQILLVAAGFVLTALLVALGFGVMASAARVLLEARGERFDAKHGAGFD